MTHSSIFKVNLSVIVSLETESHPGDIPEKELKTMLAENAAEMLQRAQDVESAIDTYESIKMETRTVDIKPFTSGYVHVPQKIFWDIARKINITAIGQGAIVVDIKEIISWITDEDSTLGPEDKDLQDYLKNVYDNLPEDVSSDIIFVY